MKRFKLVLSCYACEPNRGSEPGAGWAWALGMAKRHETYVLTRANNREVIETELARLNLQSSATPTFIYVDLPSFMCRLKKRGIVPVSLYYLLWQFKARKTLDSLHLNADIIHHVTFNSFVCPGVWWNRKEKVVLGPLGGMSITARHFLRLFRFRQKLYECLRAILLRAWKINPLYMTSRKHCDALLFVGAHTLKTIGSPKKRQRVVMDAAVPISLESVKYDAIPGKENQFVFAGVLEPRKGLEIALRACQRAFGGKGTRPLLKIFGAGSEEARGKRLAKDLQIDNTVQFCGKLSQVQLWEEMRRSRALVFPSVRDTSGYVMLEAMAVGTPVICFLHQGAAEVTDDACAIRVEPVGWESSLTGMADALQRCDLERSARLGFAGRKRALQEFSWESKFDVVDEVYFELMEKRE